MTGVLPRLNGTIETGVEPRQVREKWERGATITVKRVHGLFMEVIRQGAALGPNARIGPGELSDKLAIFGRVIALSPICISGILKSGIPILW